VAAGGPSAAPTQQSGALLDSVADILLSVYGKLGRLEILRLVLRKAGYPAG